MSPVLAVTTGPAAGVRVAVDKRLVVGRRDADLTLDDPEISRRHATVEPAPDGTLVVTDLGSTNGTWVNGARIAAPTAVRPGDELGMGDSRIRVEPAQQAAPSPPARPPAPQAQPQGQPLPVGAGAPPQPFGAFGPASVTPASRRRSAATRLPAGMIATWVVVAADALALLVYFAAR